MIRPVNYLFDKQCSRWSFELRWGSRTGWSVIMHGVTDEVTNPIDVHRLDGLGLEPWAPGAKPHWVHIRAWTVSGRRIVLGADRVPGYRA
jgi:hypothetical protein